MSGASSRRYGHQFERDAANFLTERLDTEIVTARSLGNGVQVGYDLVHPDGWPVFGRFCIEAKATKGRHRPTEWCRQAREQCEDGCTWAVVAKVPHKPVGEGEAYLVLSSLVPAVGGSEVRRLSVNALCDLLVAFGQEDS